MEHFNSNFHLLQIAQLTMPIDTPFQCGQDTGQVVMVKCRMRGQFAEHQRSSYVAYLNASIPL